MQRADKRNFDQFRPVSITPGFINTAPGSALIEIGNTRVICTATYELKVPDFLMNKGKGWLTAEYGMLPASTPQQRKQRESRSGKTDGRSQEIQRLIGRSLRAVVDLELMGEKTVWIDCDVIQADGGTRTAAITGSFVALYQAVKYMLSQKLLIKNPIITHLAAVSVGRVSGQLMLDLSYPEDSSAEVDLNMVMTDQNKIIEIQGTAEAKPFTEAELNEMISLGKKGINDLIRIQKQVLSKL
ncbi:MAG: ribonuclease PH [Candidatus Brocadiia bacterium]